MEELLTELSALCTALGAAGAGLRLIGGLAVRLHVGAHARVTRDIDLVTMTPEAHEALLGALSVRGYVIGTAGQWWRAAPADGSPRYVDIARHPVVDARTFEAVCLRGSPRTELIRGAGVPIAAATDLALLKLLACRDQDLVDVLLLAAGGAIDTDEIARSAALDDVERHVSAGAMRARHELASGGLAATALQALGRPASEHEQHALEEMLRALAREDL